MKILILHKNINWGGGVVNIVRMLMSCGGGDELTSFFIGPRSQNENRLLSTIRPLLDAVSLAFKPSVKNNDLIFVNPSLDTKPFYRDGLFVWVASVLLNKPVLVFYHGWSNSFYNKLSASAIMRWYFNQTFARASQSIVLSDQFNANLQALGVNQSQVTTLSTMYQQDDIPKFEEFVEQPQGNIRLLFLSRVVKEKGIYEAINAFQKARADYPQLILDIAGDGPELANVKRYVGDRGFNDGIVFHGYVAGEEKKQLLADAGIFLFPAYYGEGCPVALLEAMASGLPCIVGAAGGISGIFDERNGVLLEQVTDQTVLNAIEALVSDQNSMVEIARHNFQYASMTFERNIVTRKIFALCERAIS